MRVLVGISSLRSEIATRWFAQPSEHCGGDSLLPAACLATTDFDMSAPNASSSAPRGSRDSAVPLGGPGHFVIHSDLDGPMVDRRERGSRRYPVLGRAGDSRRRRSTSRAHQGNRKKDPRTELQTLSLCAEALGRASSRFINTSELWKCLDRRPEGTTHVSQRLARVYRCLWRWLPTHR